MAEEKKKVETAKKVEATKDAKIEHIPENREAKATGKSQDNPTGTPEGRHPDNSLLNQIADPVPTVNPAEPPVPSKRDQPAIPLEDDLHYQIQTIINDAHRGINPDPTKLPADKKAKLLEFLDQESEKERVFRDDSRELTREKLRELLGGRKLADRNKEKQSKAK